MKIPFDKLINGQCYWVFSGSAWFICRWFSWRNRSDLSRFIEFDSLETEHFYSEVEKIVFIIKPDLND